MSTNKQIIHFYRFLDYEDLNSLNFQFEKPSKDIDSNIYFAKLKTPLYFYLPRSEILEVFQDDFSRNKARYRIDLEEHPELLEFCENLDALCVNLASQNSKQWFSKSLTSDVLIKYLQGLYDSIEEEVTIDIDIDNLSHLDGLSEYNNDEQKNLLIEINSIEFFKQTFRLKITLDSIVDAEDIIDDDDEEEEIEDDMNFSHFLEKTTSDKEYIDRENNKKNIEEIVSLGSADEHDVQLNTNVEVNTDVIPEDTHQATTDENNLQEALKEETLKEETVLEEAKIDDNKSQDNKVEAQEVQLENTETSELPIEDVETEMQGAKNQPKKTDVVKNVVKVEETLESQVEESKIELQKGGTEENTKETDNKSISTSEVINNEVLMDLAENVENNDLQSTLTKDEINEIEELISLKNREKEKYLINAERAEKASKSLFQKAKETAEEIQSLSSRIKNTSSIGNSQNI